MLVFRPAKAPLRVKSPLTVLLRKLETSTEKRERQEIVTAILKRKRAVLRREWSGPSSTKAEAAGRKRAINEKVQLTARKLKERPQAFAVPRSAWLRRIRESKVLDVLYPERRDTWIPPHMRKLRSEPPAIELRGFSFLDNPNATLQGLRDIAMAEAAEAAALIHFRDPHCTDPTPFMVLAEVWSSLLPVFRGGEMPLAIQKVLIKVGLQRALGISLVGLTELQDVWAFPLQRRRPRNTSESPTRFLDVQSQEVVSDRFCKALDVWLSMPEIKRRLTDEGRAWIKNIINELLDNAERHSAPPAKDGDWSIAGFMARRPEELSGEYIYRCHLGILSIGASFAESLQTASKETRDEIDAYCRQCEQRGCRQSREALTTLFALQDAVTRDPIADAEGRGGFGLQEVLELVDDLGGVTTVGREPRVTIVSGRSCIMLRPPYIKGQRAAGDDAPRLLWCNPSNSGAEPPDEGFVFDLAHRFPGTVISIAFTLDPDYLGRTDDAGNQT